MTTTNQPSDAAMELLPCPFCGGEANADGHTKYSRPLSDTWWADGTEISETFFVNCMKCGTRSRGGLCDGYQTRAEAITAWNTRADRRLTPIEPGWRCFHCGEDFTDERCARQHFGLDESHKPACVIKGQDEGLLGALRKAEAAAAEAWGLLHNESGDFSKAYHGAVSRHSQALIHAEQSGYDKGLADGRATPPAPVNSDASAAYAKMAAEAEIGAMTKREVFLAGWYARDPIPELSLPYELKALSGDHIADAGNMVSDAGLVEADAALEAALKAAKAQLQECAQCLLDAERTIQSLSAIPTPAVNAELVEAKCANCKGMIGDLAEGRDPEELCDTCYEDAVFNELKSVSRKGDGA